MKKIIFTLICLAGILNLSSQITLEHTYPNAGYFCSISIGPSVVTGAKPFYMVSLEVSGQKYVSIDSQNQSITFYNLDHSFYKSISYSAVPLLGNQAPDVEKLGATLLYISEKLFDTDNQIEFMYTVNNQSGCTTQIVNEDGSIILSANNEAPLVKSTQHNQSYPIYNTPVGTKMILSRRDSTAKVYSLGGTFTELVKNNNIFSENASLGLYPNPANKGRQVALEYNLPNEIKYAELVIHDELGKEIVRYTIANEMDKIIIDTDLFSAGIYYYTVVSNAKIIGTKKSILIE